MLLSIRHSFETEPAGLIGRIDPVMLRTMYNRKALPVLLKVMNCERKILSIGRLDIASVVEYNSESDVIDGSVGSPTKKLTGILSVMGRSPSLMMLKRTLMPRSPQIGGITSTAGV